MAQSLNTRPIACLFLATTLCACTGIVGGDSKLETAVTVQRLSPAAGSRRNAPEIVCDRIVDDFSASTLGELPESWETRKQDELEVARKEAAYVVVQDGDRRVLRAQSVSQPITLGRGIEKWDLLRYPFLSWEWKVTKFPEAANETRSGADDTAASISMVWLIGLPFVVRQIRYTYSTTLPVGTRASNRLGHDQLLVLASSTASGASSWRRTRVNVLHHYRQFFGREDAAAPTGIAVTTDADDTGSRAEAYYANFRLCRYATEPGDETR